MEKLLRALRDNRRILYQDINENNDNNRCVTFMDKDDNNTLENNYCNLQLITCLLYKDI